MTSPQFQSAFQWWQDCWLRDAAQQEKRLRDGSLQDLLALRRGVELTLLTGLSPPSSEMTVWLKQLEMLYQSLDRLGDRLKPAYVEESLDLALRHMMQPWIDKYPGITLSIQHSTGSSTSEFNHILLFAIDQLLLLFLQVQDMMLLRILLTKKDTLPILSLCLELTQHKSENLDSVVQKLEYLQLVFPVLVNGHFTYETSPTLLRCEFSWDFASL